MMSLPWDQIAVYAIVALAAAYLARSFRGKKKGACGGCGTCGSIQPAQEPPTLVQLEPRRSTGDRG